MYGSHSTPAGYSVLWLNILGVGHTIAKSILSSVLLTVHGLVTKTTSLPPKAVGYFWSTVHRPWINLDPGTGLTCILLHQLWYACTCTCKPAVGTGGGGTLFVTTKHASISVYQYIIIYFLMYMHNIMVRHLWMCTLHLLGAHLFL